jgi:hypothetical protein
MANNDSTRPGFDLSFLDDDDGPLTIEEAACAWYRLKSGMTAELIKLYPVEWENAKSRATAMVRLAKAGRLPYEKPVPKKNVKTSGRVIGSQYLGTAHLSRPATSREDDDWSAARVARADLRAYAESIGQRPAFLFPEIAGAETKHCAPTQSGAAGSNTNDPPAGWARGIRRVAWDAAAVIVKKGVKLTGQGLEIAMHNSNKVELKNDEYQLKSTEGDLNEREMKVKPKTIIGWVTELKKLLK